MRCLRLIAVGICFATLAAPAFAGNEAAPGQLKDNGNGNGNGQQPAAQPVPTTPAPTPAPAPKASPKSVTKSPATPVTKGTIKKAPAVAAPVATKPRTTSRARATTRTRRASTPTRTRSHGSGVNRGKSPKVLKGDGSPAADGPATAAEARARAAARKRAAAKKKNVPAVDVKAEPERTGLARITQAADNVVEVIPGALVLALAGLVAMIGVLIVRSWLMERRRGRALEESYTITVQALATAIEAKDHTTGGHIERVRSLGLLLAGELVPRDAKDPQMAYGFLLHDIGKLSVPDAILRAPGALTEKQWALMRRHPEEGVRMLSSIPFLDKALYVVRHHHERWDGTGYPDGLAGEEIPLWARIFSVVDALDAMTAERPYRSAEPYEAALEELRRHAGTQFDPEVVAALERIPAADIECLLEPAQCVDRADGAETGDLEPLEAILDAAEAARLQMGDVAPAAAPTAPAGRERISA